MQCVHWQFRIVVWLFRMDSCHPLCDTGWMWTLSTMEYIIKINNGKMSAACCCIKKASQIAAYIVWFICVKLYTYVYIWRIIWKMLNKSWLLFQMIFTYTLCLPIFFELLGFLDGASSKEPSCQHRRHKRLGFDPWVEKISWRRTWQLTPVFLPGEFHGQRSLAGYSS